MRFTDGYTLIDHLDDHGVILSSDEYCDLIMDPYDGSYWYMGDSTGFYPVAAHFYPAASVRPA